MHFCQTRVKFFFLKINVKNKKGNCEIRLYTFTICILFILEVGLCPVFKGIHILWVCAQNFAAHWDCFSTLLILWPDQTILCTADLLE